MRTCFLFTMNPVRCLQVENCGRRRLLSARKWHFSGVQFLKQVGIIENLIITHQKPIEAIKCGYPCHKLGYPSKYCNYTSKMKLGQFPKSHIPPATPQWITFLIVILQKILLNIKDVEFVFRMGCILVLFMFLQIINVQFTNFRFLNFYFS